jgi:hypothetical protein
VQCGSHPGCMCSWNVWPQWGSGTVIWGVNMLVGVIRIVGCWCWQHLHQAVGVMWCSVIDILVVCAHGGFGLNGAQALSYGGAVHVDRCDKYCWVLVLAAPALSCWGHVWGSCAAVWSTFHVYVLWNVWPQWGSGTVIWRGVLAGVMRNVGCWCWQHQHPTICITPTGSCGGHVWGWA